jgi:hypothetical protein
LIEDQKWFQFGTLYSEGSYHRKLFYPTEGVTSKITHNGTFETVREKEFEVDSFSGDIT